MITQELVVQLSQRLIFVLFSISIPIIIFATVQLRFFHLMRFDLNEILIWRSSQQGQTIARRAFHFYVATLGFVVAFLAIIALILGTEQARDMFHIGIQETFYPFGFLAWYAIIATLIQLTFSHILFGPLKKTALTIILSSFVGWSAAAAYLYLLDLVKPFFVS